MSESGRKLRALSGSWLLVLSVLVTAPFNGTMALTSTAVANDQFPQTAGNGGFIVEADSLDAGNVEVSVTSRDTSEVDNVTVVAVTFYNGVGIDNFRVTKNYDDLAGPSRTELNSSSVSVDSVTIYVDEIYVESGDNGQTSVSDYWTTSPENSDFVMNAGNTGGFSGSTIKINAHGFSGASFPTGDAQVVMREGERNITLDATCNGC